MVRLRGAMTDHETRGWLGGDMYGKKQYYLGQWIAPKHVVRNPYPIGLLGHIHIPYSLWDRNIHGFYSISAFAVNPYKKFIAQYYSVKGWCYQVRRTWHGMQPVAMRAGINNQPSKPYELAGQVIFKEAAEIWHTMNQATKDVYNRMRYPIRANGYNRFISLYLRTTQHMPIYWGTLQRSADDNRSIEQKMIDQDAPVIRYPFNFRQYQLFNAVLHQGPGFPDGPTEGQLFYNSSDDKVYVYKNNAWSELGGAAAVARGWLGYRRANRYHIPPHTGKTVQAEVNMFTEMIFAVPFYAPVEITVKGIAICVFTKHASNVRLGIYEDDGTVYPGSLVVDGGEQSCNEWSERVAAMNQVLGPDKLYWLVAHFQGSPGVAAYDKDTALMLPLGAQYTDNSYVGTSWFKYETYDALPATFYSGAAEHNTYTPLISVLVG